MLRLLEFLYRWRVFGLFVLLEGICLWLIFSYNNRYNTYFLNTSNVLVGGATEQITNVNNYFNLQDQNLVLAKENLKLRRLLSRPKVRVETILRDDSASYDLVLAKVVNSSYRKSRNFLTLRILESDSVKPGMGVISSDGVVGRVKSVSRKYATVVSLLNPNLMVSGRIKRNNSLSTVQWDGSDPLQADLKYVPRHLSLQKGDTVITSGFNTVFPEGFTIGYVSENELTDENPFYDARLSLATDFTTLRYAYIVQVRDKEEWLALEKEVNYE